MSQYDPQLIMKFADQLYARAAALVIGYVVAGGAVGFGVAMGIASAAKLGPSSMMLMMVFAIGGMALGFVAGQSKAFVLRLTAQQALCQLQIEVNTRLVATRGEQIRSAA